MRQVVRHSTPDVCFIEQVQPVNKIYVSLGLDGKAEGKLHHVGVLPDRWTFILLKDSVCWSWDAQGTAEDAITTEMEFGKVMELDTLAELKELL